MWRPPFIGRSRAAPPSSGGVSKAQLKAVERVIRDHHDLLTGWLTKKFGDSQTAGDIAQEACLRVWRRAQQTTIDDPKAFLFKTAANLAVNEFKLRRRHSIRHVESTTGNGATVAETVPSDDPSPERSAEARQRYALCLSAIRSLPERERRAFVMSRFEELTYRQIAERLCVSESSVEKYIISALKKLRAAMAPEGDCRRVLRFPESGSFGGKALSAPARQVKQGRDA